MPWRSPMNAKEALIQDVSGGMSVTVAAEIHGVKRSCAYKWVRRYREMGSAGLQELSRAPEYSPNRTPQTVVDELLALKQKYPHFGPAKLVPMLEERHGKRSAGAPRPGQEATVAATFTRSHRACSIHSGGCRGHDDHGLQRAVPDE